MSSTGIMATCGLPSMIPPCRNNRDSSLASASAADSPLVRSWAIRVTFQLNSQNYVQLSRTAQVLMCCTVPKSTGRLKPADLGDKEGRVASPTMSTGSRSHAKRYQVISQELA